MRYAKPVFSLLVVLMMLAVTFSAASAQGETPDVQPDASYPVPTFPTDDFLMVKKPIFKFTIDPVAVNYKIKVWNYYSEEVLYTIKGKHCEPTYCFLQATTDLKAAVRSMKNGYYAWSVRSKHDDGWKSWSAPAYFVVLSKGFTSNFDTPDSKWSALNGTWTVTSAGYLKSLGVKSEFGSIAEKHLFSSFGMVYEVKFRRKADSSSQNILYFLSEPGDLEFIGTWKSGYEFSMNYAKWSLIRRENGTPFVIAIADFSETYYDWVKVTIWRYGSDISLWVNEDYIGTYQDATYNFGYVGIGMLVSQIEKSPLQVDYAKVWYQVDPPYPEY